MRRRRFVSRDATSILAIFVVAIILAGAIAWLYIRAYRECPKQGKQVVYNAWRVPRCASDVTKP